jgi:hypothetical protein
LENGRSIPFHTLKKIYKNNDELGNKVLEEIKYARYMEKGLAKKEALPLLAQVQAYEYKVNSYNSKYQYAKESLSLTDVYYKEKKFSLSASQELKKIADESIDMAELALDFATSMPLIATGRGLYEFYNGKSILTGRQLSNFERGVALSIAIIDLTPSAWIAKGVRGAWIAGELGTRLVARGIIKAGFEDALILGIAHANQIQSTLKTMVAIGVAKVETIKRVVEHKLFFKFLPEETYLARGSFRNDIIEFENQLAKLGNSSELSRNSEEYLMNRVKYSREGAELTTAEVVNAELAEFYSVPPFMPNEIVIKNHSNSTDRFIRLYNEEKTKKVGNFVLREKDIKEFNI